MKLKTILSVLFLAIATLAHAQTCNELEFSNPYWSSYFGGNGIDEIMDISIDQINGQVYIIGHTTSSNLSANNTIGTLGTKNTFITSINPDASLAWTTIIGEWNDPHSIGIDSNGDLVLVGMTHSNTLFGPNGVPGYDKTYNGGQDVLILKLDKTGQNIIYSSYYGGNGDELFEENDQTMEVEFHKDKIYIVGETTSTDLLVSQNAIEQNPSRVFVSVINTNANLQLEYCTYFNVDKSQYLNLLSYSIAVNKKGELSFISHNSLNYNSITTTNEISELQPDALNPFPLLIRFNNNYDISYATHLSIHKKIWGTGSCTFNGVANTYGYFDFDLEVDNADNIYLYQTAQGFRSPLLRSQDVVSSSNYFPSLLNFNNDCETVTGSNIIKLNFCESNNPFIEFVIFALYGESNAVNPKATSDIEIDDYGRIHYIASYESSSPLWAEENAPINELGGNYTIYDLEQYSAITRPLFNNTDIAIERENYFNNFSIYDNKAFITGRATDIIQTTPNWINEQGITNSVPQANYAGSDADGIIQVIDNNCLDIPFDCSCHPHPEYDALQEFYDLSNGDMWYNTQAGNQVWFEDCDPCGYIDNSPWFGLTCDIRGRIVELLMPNNNMTGVLPQSLTGFPFLKKLDVNGDFDPTTMNLSGQIPDVSNMNLNRISIGGNNLMGSISSDFTQMTSLNIFFAPENQLSGAIPSFNFTKSPNLIDIRLNDNQLTGGIPLSIAQLTNLTTLTLDQNQLSGCYEMALQNLCTILPNLSNGEISSGNSFDAGWTDFCNFSSGVCTTNTTDISSTEFKLFPNPTSSILTIETSAFVYDTYQIINSSGNLLLTGEIIENNTMIDLTKISTGIYLLNSSYKCNFC